MQLKTYLDLNRISHAEFGALVGASEHGVRKWVSGERVPRPDAIRKINEITGGDVSPADFFDLVPAGGAV